MRVDLVVSGWLIVAEAAMMAAAPLAGVPEIMDALGGEAAIQRACDPADHLGQAPEMVDRMLSRVRPGS